MSNLSFCANFAADARSRHADACTVVVSVLKVFSRNSRRDLANRFCKLDRSLWILDRFSAMFGFPCVGQRRHALHKAAKPGNFFYIAKATNGAIGFPSFVDS
eukprot:4685565-Pleurochrysis_carterae.AAC.1